MKHLGNGLERWWEWSTAEGKRRKIIGFGVPALLLIVLITALTPSAPESEHILLTPSPEPTATEATGDTRSTPTATALSSAVRKPSPTPLPEGWEAVTVAGVTDGDTVVLADGRRLRYIGVDTPETVDPGQPVACSGREASARNVELVLDRTVLLEGDVSDVDRFGRLLRYVYLEDGRMVNEVLVAEGFAWSKAYPPDTKHQAALDAAQERARAAKLGLWAACDAAPAPTPTVMVTVPGAGVSCPQGCEVPPEGCLIKGNISDERIYHVPGQRDYEITTIRPENGERWFCTEAEAEANGWRKAQR